jgi:hypothetical protein
VVGEVSGTVNRRGQVPTVQGVVGEVSGTVNRRGQVPMVQHQSFRDAFVGGSRDDPWWVNCRGQVPMVQHQPFRDAVSTGFATTRA